MLRGRRRGGEGRGEEWRGKHKTREKGRISEASAAEGDLQSGGKTPGAYMQKKGVSAQHLGGSPKYEASNHSAATTEPSSSPRDPRDMASVASGTGSPSKGPADESQLGGGAPSPKWIQLRDALMRCAAEGDKFCEKYGDIVANQAACERFLQ